MVEQRQGLRRCLNAIRKIIFFVFRVALTRFRSCTIGENVIICDNRTLHDLYPPGYLRANIRWKCFFMLPVVAKELHVLVKTLCEVRCVDRFRIEGMSIFEVSTQR